jgi:hypothetical protein
MADADTSLFFQRGMMVSLSSGHTGIIKAEYDYAPFNVPSAKHRRFKVEIAPGDQVDVSGSMVLGRLCFERPPLQVIQGDRA